MRKISNDKLKIKPNLRKDIETYIAEENKNLNNTNFNITIYE